MSSNFLPSSTTFVISLGWKYAFKIGDSVTLFSSYTVNDTFRLKSYEPEFDNLKVCDFYSGSLFLLQTDFKYYYIEYDDGFDVRFSMTDFIVKPMDVITLTWKTILKALLTILIIFIVALIVWHNSCRTKTHVEEINFEDERKEKLFEMKNLN